MRPKNFGLVIFVGLGGITGYTRRLRFGPKSALAAGALSGVLGGLVGNQGGIRSAALLGFGLERHAFVATATAIGLIVDAARMPVYFVTLGHELQSLAGPIVISTIGVLAGTFAGTRVLRGISDRVFQPTIGVLLLILGIFMLGRAIFSV